MSRPVIGSGPVPAPFMIVGEAPGEEEERIGTPFVGSSGQELDRMLHEAGLLRSDAYVTNVCKFRPPTTFLGGKERKNDITAWIPPTKKAVRPHHVRLHGVAVEPVVKDGYEKLLLEIAAVKPRAILTFGNVSLWALTQVNSPWSGISNWRGSELSFQGIPLVPTFHPAYINRSWEDRSPAICDLRRFARYLNGTPPAHPQWNFHVRPSLSGALERLSYLRAKLDRGPLPLAIDIETSGGGIDCISIAWTERDSICVPFRSRGNRAGYWPSTDTELEVVLALKDTLTHANCRGVGQNFLYDAQYIARFWGFIPRIDWDTIIAQNVLYPGTPRALHYLASLYCDHYKYWKEDGKVADDTVPEERRWTYNCEDSVRTLEVARVQREVMRQAELEEPMLFQQSLFMPVLRMMLRGIRPDESAKPALSRELGAKLAEVQEWFKAVLGHPLNPASTKQMHILFYEDFAQKKILHRKTGRPTLDDTALQTIGQRTPLLRPLVNAIADYRTLGVFKTTFVDARADIDGRMRCSFDPAGTETFRFSSSKNAFGSGCNFENIPGEGTKAGNKAKMRGSLIEFPDVRKLFLPDEGTIFWNADLDRADLQVVVWEAQDEELKTALRDGIDLHLLNAQALFNLPFTIDDLRDPVLYKQIRAKYGPQREFCKTFIHGTNYGGKPRTMAENSRCSIAEADTFQRRWFQRHPGILDWHNRTLGQLATSRSVRNAFGYRRFYFDRIEGLLPEALAWVPQSTVACVINRGLRAIDSSLAGGGTQVLLQVHDSLAGQSPVAGWSSQREQILSCMRITVPYAEPLVIPVSMKESTISWGDCKSETE